MKKALGKLLMSVGVVMVLAAGAMLFYNRTENEKAEEAASDTLEQLKCAVSLTPELPDWEAWNGEEEDAWYEEAQARDEAGNPILPVLPVDGYDYIGIVSLPTLELELPVLDRWDAERLQKGPCRYYGSPEDGNLVLAAHNFPAHFGKINTLRIQDPVYFTAVDGSVSCYVVETVSVIAPTAISFVQNSGYDLLLFTCTYGGQSRVIAGCRKTAE